MYNLRASQFPGYFYSQFSGHRGVKDYLWKGRERLQRESDNNLWITTKYANWFIVCWIVAFVALSIALVVLFGKGSQTNVSFSNSITTTYGATVAFQEIGNVLYNSSLNNPASSYYQYMAALACSQLENVFATSMKAFYLNCSVLEFSQGSVITKFGLSFDFGPSNTNQVNNCRLIRSTLIAGIQNGLTRVSIDSSSITVNAEATTTEVNECQKTKPCDQICLPFTQSQSFECACDVDYTLVDNTKCVANDICSSQPCYHFGSCVPISDLDFQCICPPLYTGKDCGQVANYCASQPCASGGQCINTNTGGYFCVCPAGFSGVTCQQVVDFCASQPCANAGQCNTNNGYACDCSAGFSGVTCQQEILECSSAPCLNGAKCVDVVNGYQCTCAVGYIGQHCETNVNRCASSPCQNGATCIPGVEMFTCECAAGYNGILCQTESLECSSAPCLSGATCTDVVNGYQCTCAVGYMGQHCETNVNRCASSPCQNGATCIPGVEMFTCECAAGYNGILCQTATAACSPTTCLNGGICYNLLSGAYECVCSPGYSGNNCQTEILKCSSAPCLSGATCTDVVNGYQCTCALGYIGQLCETNVNRCASSPCQNGATCIPGVEMFTCECAAGYNGILCQTEILECSSEPCQNGATCTNIVNGYQCTCPVGYIGQHCETNVNRCSSSPCQNEGLCFSGMDTFNCICPCNYTGQTCETSIDYCLNGGTCLNVIDSFICTCAAGYTGTTCETEINYCASYPCENGATCVPSVNSYSCNCAKGFSNTHCQPVGSFFATTTTSSSGGNPFMYTTVPINDNGQFDTVGLSTFTCNRPGLYWMFITEVWPGTSWATFGISGFPATDPPAELKRLHSTFYASDVISRDFIRNVTDGLQLTTYSNLNTYGDITIGSAWGGFMLENLMSTPVAFEVYCSANSFSGIYDTVLLNVGSGWSSIAYAFIAPVDGAYYFSYSAGSIAYTAIWMQIEVFSTATTATYCDNEIYQTTQIGVDVASRGCFLSLKEGDIVIPVIENSNNGDSSYSETSFRGFLYSPTQGSPVAWSVHTSNSYVTMNSVIPFDQVYVNIGLPWQTDNSYILIIPTTGLYYIEMNGQANGGFVDMRLMRNGATLLARLYTDYTGFTRILRSSSWLFNLNAGDTLQVIGYGDCNLFGNGVNGISFQGFLVYYSLIVV